MRNLFAVLLLCLSAVDARAQPTCGARDVLLKALAKDFQEQPIGIGLSSNGAVLELLASPEGTTWTLMATQPSGSTCLIGSGEAWIPLKPKTAAEMTEQGS